MRLGKLALRGLIGGLFVGHGTQKLFGWFDGPGLDGAAGMMEKLELRPPKRHAVLAGTSEALGGALLAAGALTALAAGVAGSYLADRPPVNEQPEGEPTGRFTRVEEPVHA